MKALVVLSGGQDSATCLLWALKTFGGASQVEAVTFDYGQRHRVEIEAAKNIAGFLGVKHHVLVLNQPGMPQLLRGMDSPLTNPSKALETYSDPESMEATIGDRVELTFVPLRNPVFLLVAANLAVAIGSHVLVTGICQADNANYPDCTEEFRASAEKMIRFALGHYRPDYKGPRFCIDAPLMYKSKAETVQLAMALDFGRPVLALTHTCYAGEVPPCGKCHACVLRADGFAKAGVDDPLVTAWSWKTADPAYRGTGLPDGPHGEVR